MRIANNIQSLNVLNRQKLNRNGSAKSMEKLSSGLRINQAGDDAAGLSISQKMRAQIRGLNQASRNAQDGISLIQTAEGGLSVINDPHLQRLRELAIQSSNDTLVDSDREKIQMEVDEIIKAIDDIANNTEFNGIHLLNGANPNGSEATVITPPAYNYENLFDITVQPNGGVDIKTNEGYPHTSDDDNATLIFPGLTTSSPSILVNGVQTDLWETSSNGTNQISPSEFETTWDIGNSYVIQKVKIVQDKLEFTYSVTNNSAADESIGVYFHIDTMLGNDDAAPFIVDGITILNEESFSGASLPQEFTVYNNVGQDIQANGIISGSGILLQPDEFRVGNYADVSGAYTWTDTDDLVGDSGYAVVWNERNISAGSTLKVNTFYGISIPPTLPPVPNPEPIELGPYDITLQIGANAGNEFKVELSDVRTTELGIHELDLSTRLDSQTSINTIDKAINIVVSERSKYGTYHNALEHVIKNVDNMAENLLTAESRIADVDMAKEMMSLSKLKILEEAANAMMAQSNQIPQGILQLLK